MTPLPDPASFSSDNPPQIWITELAPSLPPPSSKKDEATTADDDDEEEEDDWRAFFNDDADPNKEKSSEPRPRSQRAHKLSIQKSCVSLSAHGAQTTATWLALLPALSSSVALSSRALTVLHGVVVAGGGGQGTVHAGAARFRKPIKLMDWVAACVDHGRRRPLAPPSAALGRGF
jgi:U3 small nucleolar RNA-associated protein 19